MTDVFLVKTIYHGDTFTLCNMTATQIILKPTLQKALVMRKLEPVSEHIQADLISKQLIPERQNVFASSFKEHDR